MASEDKQRRTAVHGLDTPLAGRRSFRLGINPDRFGRWAEAIARFMGTPVFLVWMTVICAAWLLWNTLAPEQWQFDPRALNFTLLTLILSLQASYAAPLLLLADNRAADREKIDFESDRRRDERHLADTEYLMREVSSLRIAVRDMASRDFIRSELKDLLADIEEQRRAEREQDRAELESRPDAKPDNATREDPQ